MYPRCGRVLIARGEQEYGGSCPEHIELSTWSREHGTEYVGCGEVVTAGCVANVQPFLSWKSIAGPHKGVNFDAILAVNFGAL
jgi:hypothetical protein